jgi:hypothetical protein
LISSRAEPEVRIHLPPAESPSPTWLPRSNPWDTANKATELSDFSVRTTWGVKGKNLFLLGLFRKRLEYPALKRAVRDQQHLFNASVVLIEDKASGTQLIQDLIADGCHGVTRYQPTGDKTMRMHAPLYRQRRAELEWRTSLSLCSEFRLTAPPDRMGSGSWHPCLQETAARWGTRNRQQLPREAL